MKAMKLGVCFALALVFAIGLCTSAQAGILDSTWYKGKIQGDSRAFVISDVTGEVEKFKLNGDFYFKVCTPDGVEPNSCLGEDYDVVLAIADFDGDGDFELTEVFILGINTCGLTENTFTWLIEIDDIDWFGLFEEVAEIDGVGVGKVKGDPAVNLRANSGNGGGAVTINDTTGLNFPDGVFRKISLKADPIAVEDLPFTLEELLAAGIIEAIDELVCFSKIPVIPDDV